MNNKSKGNSKYVVGIALGIMLWSITLLSASNYTGKGFFYNALTAAADTVPKKIKEKSNARPNPKDTSTIKDTTGGGIQKVDSFDVKVSKDSLDAPVTYSASDSMVMDVPEKKIWLYNEGKVTKKYMGSIFLTPPAKGWGFQHLYREKIICRATALPIISKRKKGIHPIPILRKQRCLCMQRR